MKLLFFIFLFTTFGNKDLVNYQNTIYAPLTIEHAAWDNLLKKYVTDKGVVNYKGFIADIKVLDDYLNLLSKNSPTPNWTKDQQKAYWINAYNAYTIKLITQYYPLESIKDVGSKMQVPFVNTPWDIKFITIGTEKMDLNNIEHGKLRKQFDDPRIHFAIVCASASCPKLLNEAYTAEKLNAQLDQQATDFLTDSKRNVVTTNNPKLSKLFDWYKGDFTKKTSLIEYINKYSKVKIDANAKLSYLDYSWKLNDK
jgi:Protein of unknown function, DUF547